MGGSVAYLPRRKLRFSQWVLVAVAVLVALVVLDAGLYTYAERPGGPLHPYLLQISVVNWFLAQYLLTTGAGFNATAGGPLTVTLSFNNCELFCSTLTVGSAATNTSGFAVERSNLPLSIPPGTTGNISVTLSVPGSGYSGPISVVLGH